MWLQKKLVLSKQIHKFFFWWKFSRWCSFDFVKLSCWFEPGKWLDNPAGGRSRLSPDIVGGTNNNPGVNDLQRHTHTWTHSVDRRRNIHMDPDARPVKAQMGTDEETSTGALSVLAILSEEVKKKKKRENLKKRQIKPSKTVRLIRRSWNFHPSLCHLPPQSSSCRRRQRWTRWSAARGSRREGERGRRCCGRRARTRSPTARC